MISPQSLEAHDSAFVSEHVFADDAISPEDFVLVVGAHSVINPRLQIATIAAPGATSTAVATKITIGEYCIVSDMCTFELDLTRTAAISVGDYTHIEPAARISADTTIGKFCHIGAHAHIQRGARIGDCVHIAPGVVVRTGEVVSPHTVVAYVGEEGEVQTLAGGEAMGKSARKSEMQLHVGVLMRSIQAGGSAAGSGRRAH
ncbi:uncharacterized protein V1518DRAFT_419556 [Limtongia smithiae]|uniref:uncharacterized protein n=1 Tax=Limtongia smithiae TaxID=1125753 RepID=UPI0034CDCD62